jgi:hypothetical protein
VGASASSKQASAPAGDTAHSSAADRRPRGRFAVELEARNKSNSTADESAGVRWALVTGGSIYRAKETAPPLTRRDSARSMRRRSGSGRKVSEGERRLLASALCGTRGAPRRRQLLARSIGCDHVGASQLSPKVLAMRWGAQRTFLDLGRTGSRRARSSDAYSRGMSTEPIRIGAKVIGTIYDLLDLLRERPGMWIGEMSVTRLSIFIQAFQLGVQAAHGSLDKESPPLQDFHDWIAGRLGRSKNGHGWDGMLLDAANGSEEAAFDRFWVELDAFRAH